MQPESPALLVSLILALALAAQMLFKLWLATRQIRAVARHRDRVPDEFAASITLQSHQRAADYTIAKLRFGLIELIVSAAVLLGWTLLGGLDWLNGALLAWLGERPLLQPLALLAAFALVNGLIDLPASLYQTFVIEQYFGFNKMTWRLWLGDLLKSLLLGVAIGAPLAALALWLMDASGDAWWLWTWGLWMAFSLLMLVVYPLFIAPLFNKFQPLQDEALTRRVTDLMARCGFAAQGLFVMDGSRRSAHANAYFTGFGASKRVVFFDTLLRQLNAGQVEAVLAHELGHFKRHHIVKRMVALFMLSLVGFALLGWVSGQGWFYAGLGVRPNLGAPNDALALLLFLLAVPVFLFFIAPLPALLSRRDEFEADAYAAAHANPSDLREALLKLYQDNASTLTPDPLFVRFYYSHPPAAQRLARLDGAAPAA
ncbi:MAG: M48 family metallopeptidase [Burkholderiaceae bacterium]|jgi:STE24 endopeptidase|nr:M48 family metallopeptidase [Burkholderiaceae bacterium]